MLDFSGVLAQMEREQIAERVKDNMIMLARSGRWLGGNTPLGYSSLKVEKEVSALKKKSMFCLEQNPDEIDLARFIFSYFMEKRSLTKTLKYLMVSGMRTRNGKEFSISGIRDILTNPVYCIADQEAYQYFYDLGCQVCIDQDELDHETGLMSYAKTTSVRYKNQNTSCETWIISKGRHRGIITGKEFVYVQQLLENNKIKGINFRDTRNSVALLSGILQCTCGHMMRPKNYPASRVTEKGERTFAYRCPYKDMTYGENCNTKNVHGNTLDAAVCNEILDLAKPDIGIIPMLEELRRQVAASDIEVMSKKQIMVQEYERKKSEIQKLIASIRNLEADSVSVQYISEEIQKLDSECVALQKHINTVKEDDQEKTELAECIREITDKLTEFSKMFQDLSIIQKRDFLREIIEKVIWDGEIAHIYLRNPVPDKHRDIFRFFREKYKQPQYPKYLKSNHRIATTAGTYDRQKFSLRYIK